MSLHKICVLNVRPYKTDNKYQQATQMLRLQLSMLTVPYCLNSLIKKNVFKIDSSSKNVSMLAGLRDGVLHLALFIYTLVSNIPHGGTALFCQTTS